MMLDVSSLYHTFTVFTQWVVEGRYDFHLLPYSLKVRLNPEDADQIRALFKKGTMLLMFSVI